MIMIMIINNFINNHHMLGWCQVPNCEVSAMNVPVLKCIYQGKLISQAATILHILQNYSDICVFIVHTKWQLQTSSWMHRSLLPGQYIPHSSMYGYRNWSHFWSHSWSHSWFMLSSVAVGHQRKSRMCLYMNRCNYNYTSRASNGI